MSKIKNFITACPHCEKWIDIDLENLEITQVRQKGNCIVCGKDNFRVVNDEWMK